MLKARGYRGAKSKLYRSAKQAVMRAGNHAFVSRKLRKRNFRRLWIRRISIALRNHDINYSRFINGLTNAKIGLNRKAISNIAIEEPKAFEELVQIAKKNVSSS